MEDHKPLPVEGYRPQSQQNVDLANEGKIFEEMYLRWLDKLDACAATDKRHVALARTKIQEGAMWAIRSIFQPARAELPSIIFQDLPTGEMAVREQGQADDTGSAST